VRLIPAPAKDNSVEVGTDKNRLIGTLQRVITEFGLAVIADDGPGDGWPAVDKLKLEERPDLFILRSAIVLHGKLGYLGLVALRVANEFLPVTPHRYSPHVECLVVLEVVIGELLPVRRPLTSHHFAYLLHRRKGLGAQFGNNRSAW